MHNLELPAPVPAEAPPFRNAEEAGAWLAQQPLAQPQQMQAVLQKAVAAVDASAIPAAARLLILDRLRSAVVVAQNAIEPRYARKPLPLPQGDAELFFAARKLWRTLAVAYLRLVPHLPPPEAAVPLHRAAVALRVEQYAHFLAAYEVPPGLLELLHGVLATAEALCLHDRALTDPDYKQIRESNIAGHVAWAFLLQFADPYGLSMAQLAVTNRAFGRWRELAAFRRQPDDSSRARDLPLANLLEGANFEAGGLAWLDVRPVARKIRNRIEALDGGQLPEDLKLGRELSPTACIRLLRQLDAALRPAAPAESGGRGELTLTFGAENIYALLTGERFSTRPDQSSARTVNHNRVAVFGFDNLVTPVDAAQRTEVASETWQAADGHAYRAPAAGARLLAPCLVAWTSDGGPMPKLGVVTALRISGEGGLCVRLQWYPSPVQAVAVQLMSGKGVSSRVPVFVLGTGEGLSLVLPASTTLRPGSRLILQSDPQAPVVLGQVLERGSDFVRYAANPQ